MSVSSYTPDQDSFIVQNAGKISFAKIGKKMGKTRNQIRGRLLYLQETGKVIDLQSPAAGKQIETDSKKNSQVITCKSSTIRSLEELLKEANVDLKVWEVERHVVNKWDCVARTNSEAIKFDSKNRPIGWRRQLTATELYQVKVWLKRKSPVELANEDLRKQLLADMDAHSPKYGPIHRGPLHGEPVMAEISLPDHHFGKLAWGAETNDSYDLKIANQRFKNAVTDLLAQAKKYPVERILFPIGNDMFHVDNASNETANGTRQDCDGRWQKAYLYAKRVIIESIDLCLGIAPVHIVVVPGNHDRERAFFLGDTLQSHFRLSSEVTIDNTPDPRKYVHYGKTLLGFTHGDEERHPDLPMLMAREQKSAWAAAEHYEWHIGHFHKKKETVFTAGDTHRGVFVRILPCLTGTDSWHHRKGYIKGGKMAEMYLWRKDIGYGGHLVHVPVE